jgi:autotransporter-associated beta strand protein
MDLTEAQWKIALWLENPVDNNWNNPANWSTGAVPSGQDDAILGVSAIRDLSITQSNGIADLTFDSNEECTIINEGATVSGGAGGSTNFLLSKPSAGNATLIANGGSNGGGGGSVTFDDSSLGGTARLEVFGNGYIDMSVHRGDLSIGSIEGDGQVYLGKATLIFGTNSLTTTFSGVLHPGGPSGGGGSGALSKTGAGTLSLTGANLYTNETTVTQGTLLVSNRTGSGTGTGQVSVNAGTLGGSETIAGPVTVGTGASLTPGAGTNGQTTLTIQNALTLNSDATYTYTFKAKKNKARTDLVIANGVTINGATLNLTGQTQGSLKRGLTLTVISNTSANPISGTFSNLPDGVIVTVNGNNLQASYEGGDGNDLTLTVVP